MRTAAPNVVLVRNILSTAVHRLAVLSFCTLLCGCGTNVQWLLAEEGRLTPEADRLATTAEALGTGIEQPVYAAEDAKLEACRFLNEATVDRIQNEPSLGEQFVSDLSAVIVLLVPVGPVERCADSLKAYRTSIARLESELIELGIIARTPEGESDSSS
jgi:hypothetical protein